MGLLSREQEGSRRAANFYRAAEFSKTLRATAQNGKALLRETAGNQD